ncbi:S9 family peptidase [Luteimonas aestuarii]|uniref:S9 family peptidase n=1 Tax=Luteimonas aestuarii TaxID=453837 RepID=A0A4R5U412_9GAMM|nr:S9 family peptidase [Luteimonas aestuarii]TDK28364.1 S9 family peptidase [Luteimonas aestuarii]
MMRMRGGRMSRAGTCVVAVLCLLAGSAWANGGMTLEHVAKLRGVTTAAISPDGNQVAYALSVPRALGVDEDGPAWSELHVVDASGNSRGFVTGKVNVGGVEWFADGREIAYLAKRQGDDTRKLYRIPLYGGESRAAATLKSDITAFHLSADGRRAALLASEPESDALKALKKQGFTQKVYEEDWRPVQLWIQDLANETSQPRLVPVEGSVQSVQWSPAGDRLALLVAPRQLTDDTLVFTRVRIVSPEGRVLGTVDNPGKIGGLSWSPDGEHLAFISAEDEQDAQQGRLFVVGKNGGEWRDLLPGLEGHVVDVEWRDANTLMFLSHEGVQARLGTVAVSGGAAQTVLPATEGPVWNGFALAAQGNAVLLGSTPQHPSEAFVMAAGGGEPRRLTDSNPWLKDVRLARQEVIRYPARDGLEIEGLLVHPLDRRGNTRVPLIVVVHGGPEAHYSNQWLTAYSQPLHHAAAQGYAVFLPNYRSSTGRGVAFSKQGFGRPGMEEFDDVVDGVDYLVGTGLVDGDKVGITGGSYGGYASAWGATYYSERFAASVMFVGISDQASLVTTGDIPWEQNLVHWGTWPWENPELYRQTSPITHAQKSNTPTLILHGEADPRVPVMQSYMMYRYLKLAGQAPVRLVLYPGEGHGNARGASRYDYSVRLMQWMDHYLKGPGGEPPAYQVEYALPAAGAGR